jgi:hypothetical protein
VGGIGSNGVVGITFGVVIAIVAVGLAVLALIILRRRHPIGSYSPQAFEGETAEVVTCDDELSDFVSVCGAGSSENIWESPSLDDEIAPRYE